MTGLTDAFRANFIMMKKLNDVTQMTPMDRRNRIITFARRIHEEPQASLELTSRQIELGRDCIMIDAKGLPTEAIVLGNGKTFEKYEKADWTACFRNNQLHTVVPVKRVMVAVPKNCEADARQFLNICMQVSKGMGLEVGEPYWHIMENDRLTTYANELEFCCRKDPKLIFVILSNNNADRYAAVKKVTCCDRAIPTQCILKKNTISKKGPSGLMSIATKVCLSL